MFGIIIDCVLVVVTLILIITCLIERIRTGVWQQLQSVATTCGLALILVPDNYIDHELITLPLTIIGYIIVFTNFIYLLKKKDEGININKLIE
jgi:hypothetical protein